MASTKEWNDFFMTAGIPRSVAAQYAVTFCENRISFTMLMDLNKEYLRDMNITVLGDVICILKHAKSVQSKMTTDKVLKSSESSSSAVQKSVSEPEKTAKKPESFQGAVSSRLGPPATKEFGDSSDHKSTGVFSRLDEKRPQNDDRSDPGKSGILRKRVRDVTVANPDERVTLKRPSEKTHDKRVAFGGGADETAHKRKKYIMVQTLNNGDKVKTFIRPDDPILDRYPIQKAESSRKFRTLESDKDEFKTAKTLSDRARIVVNRQDPPRKRISPPRHATFKRPSTSSHLDTREPQRSVKTRLSLPSTSTSARSSESSSRYEPVARKRITAPSADNDEDRPYGRNRLGYHHNNRYSY